LHVVEGVWGVAGKEYKDDVRIRVTQGAETIIIFLASGIPQSQLDVLAVDFDIGNIVLENGGDVYLGFTVKLCLARLQEN